MIARRYLPASRKQFPLIDLVGIESAETALAKIEVGASLLQLYMSFMFKGLRLAEEINKGLSRLLVRKAYPQLAEAIGIAAVDRARSW